MPRILNSLRGACVEKQLPQELLIEEHFLPLKCYSCYESCLLLGSNLSLEGVRATLMVHSLMVNCSKQRNGKAEKSNALLCCHMAYDIIINWSASLDSILGRINVQNHYRKTMIQRMICIGAIPHNKCHSQLLTSGVLLLYSCIWMKQIQASFHFCFQDAVWYPIVCHFM